MAFPVYIAEAARTKGAGKSPKENTEIYEIKIWKRDKRRGVGKWRSARPIQRKGKFSFS